MGSNVERLRDEWTKRARLCDAPARRYRDELREAIEADREEGIEVTIKRADGTVHPFVDHDCGIVSVSGDEQFSQQALSEALNLAPDEQKRFQLVEVDDE